MLFDIFYTTLIVYFNTESASSHQCMYVERKTDEKTQNFAIGTQLVWPSQPMACGLMTLVALFKLNPQAEPFVPTETAYDKLEGCREKRNKE